MRLVAHSVAQLLKKLLVESSEGSGQLALVQGGLACGKTELLHEFAQQATAFGALVLGAVGSRTESDLQAGLIDQLFHSAGVPAEIIARVQRLVSADVLAKWESRPDLRFIQQHHARSVHEVSGVLLELARSQPVVIAVDDVQFADSVSMQLLLYVLRRMRSARILMVLSEWDLPQPTQPFFRAELTRRPHHELHLGQLSRDAATKLVARALGERAGTELGSAIHDLTGGNPMLVQALIEDYNNADRAGDTDDDNPSGDHSPVVGFAFGQATLACLHRWEPELLEVARGVAVLGDQGDPELIGRLMEIRSDDVERVLHVLSTAGLLLGGRLRHSVAETAVLGTLSPDQRSAMHLRAAKLLYRRGAEAIKVVRQIIASDQLAEPWMVPVLRAAAEQAMVSDDVVFAVRCLETALPAVGDDVDRLAVTAALARAVWRVNPAAAAYMPSLQAAIRDGSLQGRDVLPAVRHAMWNGDNEGFAQALQALAGASALDNAQLSAELRLACQWYYGSDRGQFPESRAGSDAGSEPWARAANRLAAVWKHKERDTRSASKWLHRL